MRTNTSTKRDPVYTHEGGRAALITPIQQLRRSVLSCLLFEREFYESGIAIADRIRDAAQAVQPSVLAALAIEARSKFHLRHCPLYLAALLAQRAQGSSIVSETIRDVIQRADELAEFLAIYAKVNGVSPDKIKPKLSNQVRKGLAMAFVKFNEYALARYNRKHAIKLRDVLFLCHARPKDEAQAALWSRMINNTMAIPDTWETELSAGKDKKATFERLIIDGKLGYLALLRNLRNMEQANVNETLVNSAIVDRKGAERVLPFRYVAAARAAPRFEAALDQALATTIKELPSLPGKTAVLVDVSVSMDQKLSEKSDMTRMDAAATLASMINAESLRVFSFSDYVVEVPSRRGMAGVDAILASQEHHGTALFDAVNWVQTKVAHDRIIVITDEQADDPSNAQLLGGGGVLRSMPNPVCANAYVINVASAKNGVGYGPWTHLDGFSEHVLRWIIEYEMTE
jgi:60 kDa SS-A/Ro ribonucleoprotein